MKYIEYLYEKHQKITNVIGTILVAWILSALVSSIISLFLPKSSPIMMSKQPAVIEDASTAFGSQQDISLYMPICTRNIFDSLKQSSCEVNAPVSNSEEEVQEVDPNAPPVLSGLNAKLLGTMVSTVEKYSFATVTESGKKEAKNFRIGDLISGVAKVYAIERNKVFFTNNGRKEFLQVDKMPGVFNSPRPTTASNPSTSAGIKVEGGKVTVSKAKVDATLQDLNPVLQQARMVPNYDNGQVDGFKIFGIRGGSIFSDLGLQNGDVINNINGTAIDSLEKALPMLQLLKTESSYTIDITRGGSKQTMNISIQ